MWQLFHHCRPLAHIVTLLAVLAMITFAVWGMCGASLVLYRGAESVAAMLALFLYVGECRDPSQRQSAVRSVQWLVEAL